MPSPVVSSRVQGPGPGDVDVERAAMLIRLRLKVSSGPGTAQARGLATSLCPSREGAGRPLQKLQGLQNQLSLRPRYGGGTPNNMILSR
jgi:hypothetical protein